MKNIFFLKNFGNQLKHTSLCKFNANIICKNYSLLQSQFYLSNLHLNSSNFLFKTNNCMKDIITLSQSEEIQINNIPETDQDEITSDMINPHNKINKNQDIQIDLKGRNSKTPKRVKYFNKFLFCPHRPIMELGLALQL